MRVLVYDIETTPILGYTWGTYQQDVIEILEHSYILCFGYTWLDEPGGVTVVSPLDPVGDQLAAPRNPDEYVVTRLWELFDEADVVVGHNSDKFDNRKANARFTYWGLGPPSPYKTVDTLKIARRVFGFPRNRLNDLGEYLDLGSKVKHQGFDLWRRCMSTPLDEAAWNSMIRYCKRDVVLLERLYRKLRAWDERHPNVAFGLDDTHRCPVCSSSRVQRRGQRRSKTMTYQQYVCLDCGAWSRERLADRSAIKPSLVP